MTHCARVGFYHSALAHHAVAVSVTGAGHLLLRKAATSASASTYAWFAGRLRVFTGGVYPAAWRYVRLRCCGRLRPCASRYLAHDAIAVSVTGAGHLLLRKATTSASASTYARLTGRLRVFTRGVYSAGWRYVWLWRWGRLGPCASRYLAHDAIAISVAGAGHLPLRKAATSASASTYARLAGRLRVFTRGVYLAGCGGRRGPRGRRGCRRWGWFWCRYRRRRECGCERWDWLWRGCRR